MTGLELLALFFLMPKGGSGGGGSVEPSGPGPSPKAKPASSDIKLPAGQPTDVKPWPASKPADLPTYPDGWEPYTPPPAPVVARASALLPELWKAGKPGVTRVEQTNGVWVTYVTFAPAKGKRGVAAYRLKDTGAQPAAKGGGAIIPASTKAAKGAPKPKAKGKTVHA